MPESVIDSFQRQKKAIQDLALRLRDLTRNQQDIFRDGGLPEKVQEYSDEKRALFQQLQEALKNIQEASKRVGGSQKEAVRAFLTAFQKELQPILEEIVAREKEDSVWLQKVKDRIKQEIDEVRDTRAKLDKVKGSYNAGYGQETQFIDDKG